jgi:thiol:disulfide interchange protein DsbD
MNLSGGLLDYLIVFWAGVVVSFTPCVYPLIPITASIVTGINTEGSRWRGFVVSLVYVLGMAITYCALGILAALTGKLFGQLQNQPAVFLLVGSVLILFSLVLFDVIPLPALGINVQGKIKARSVGTVLLLGMSSGLIVGPCTAPVLGTLLLYVGSRQNILYGASLLFVFSYGLGVSLILVGTFSSLLSRLPKSGRWLLGIKRLCGAVLLIAGEYFFIKAGRLME